MLPIIPKNDVDCFELTQPIVPCLEVVRKVYEQTLAAEERIPWSIIERPIWGKMLDDPNSWNSHLILATVPDQLCQVYGYLACRYYPGYGGYISYMGVQDHARGKGIGQLLYQKAYQIMQQDARLVDEELRFVIWESHAPETNNMAAAAAATDQDQTIKNWQARLKMFDRVGGVWLKDIMLWAPSYATEPNGRIVESVELEDSIPYQLFLKPFAMAKEQLTPGRIRKIVHDHYRRIYKQRPGDELYNRTFGVHPKPTVRQSEFAMV